MNKQLLILRHGKSDWRVEVEDFSRPLVERGKRGAELLGVWAQQQNLLPDFILSSPATRALATAQRFCRTMGISERSIYTDAAIYEANAATLKAIVNDCPHQAQRVLLVGHNPGLEHLLQDLLPEPLLAAEDGKTLPTATLAHLTLGEHWSQTSSGCGQLQSLIRAASLTEEFPFIGLAGAEFRPRPAYYYRQAAVIPYCIMENQFKLLLIRAEQKQHWHFPKGIIFPGVSPQTTAAQAAWKEAGVKGVIADEALGFDKQEKWRGQCSIEVFPMAVSEMTAPAQWQKNQQRQWFTAKQVMSEIDSPPLNKMLKQLLVLLNHYLVGKK
jgi:phosphohistidine phosphatase